MESQLAVDAQQTRQRILDVAARRFAEHGFNHVTIREICQEADANIAAVNYYFRDKLGLYKEVVERAAEAMHRSKVMALDAGEGQTPEEQLRRYTRSMLERALGPEADQEPWIEKLIGREMVEPTPAFDLIVEKGIRPTSARLAEMVAKLLGCPPDDPRVWRCALSVQAQCVFYMSAKHVFARMAPGFRFTPEVIAGLADHITDFSLAGIRAIAQKKEWCHQ
jgi:AcrR family transcriptional regulator